ncbi:MAG: TIGR04282 family arsenosugar biosynthesis glycosyltransferase [Flavobacteriaceae bacterium]
MKKPLLLVFCKNPRRGKVKTRLASAIGEEKALLIYCHLLEKTASVLQEINTDIHVYYSEYIEEDNYFKSVAKQEKIQVGESLGERMSHAFKASFKTHSPIVIIGTDLWSLEAKDILQAFESLKENNVVLGPSHDGGYYLLGLNRYLPQLFQNKKWGSDTVLLQTLSDLTNEQFSLLEEKNDIDTLEDLQKHPDLMQLSNE